MRFFSCREERGFTLVEIVLVIGVIAVLSAVVIGNLGEARKKSRDAKRISDLEQIELALRLYKDVHESYPTFDDGDFIGDGGGVDTVLNTYMGGIVKDPINSLSYRYYYDSNYVCNGKTVPVITSVMERDNTGNFTEVCTNNNSDRIVFASGTTRTCRGFFPRRCNTVTTYSYIYPSQVEILK